MHPVILRLIQKFFTERGIKITLYPVTLRLIQKLSTERVHGNFHVSCHIEFNSKKIFTIMVHENRVVPVTVIFF